MRLAAAVRTGEHEPAFGVTREALGDRDGLAVGALRPWVARAPGTEQRSEGEALERAEA